MSIKRRKLVEGIHHLKEGQQKTEQYQIVSSCDRVFKCYMEIWKYIQFSKLNPALDVKEILKDFDHHIQLPEQVMGKKSSEIVISSSRRYCLKMITDDDLSKFQQVFDQYNQFNSNFKHQNHLQSYLVDIYQVFIVHSTDGSHSITYNYILMPNIRADYDKTICVFDIKGHCDGRGVDVQDFIDFKYGKDQNFINSKQLNLVKTNLSKSAKEQFIQALSQHTRFLSKISIIDYSLLLVFYVSDKKIQQKQQIEHSFPSKDGIKITENVWMKWAIIDYFQVYNKKKQIQNKFKSVFRKNVSSVDPQTYEKRLIQFIKTNLQL